MKRKEIDIGLLNELSHIALQLQRFTEMYKLSDDNIHSLNIIALDIATIRNRIIRQ